MTRVEVEIAAPPEAVRAVFLNFEAYKDWNTSDMKYIETIPPGQPATSLAKGDRLRAGFPGMTLVPTIIHNAPHEFRWFGSAMAGAFGGEHYFGFNESMKTPGGTTFVHGEDNKGWLKFLFRPGWPLGKTQNAMFTKFSTDLKSRVEGLMKQGRAKQQFG